ncbi:hypothetical protein BV898_15943 [Hypsibius exemplaris]|uniref:Uncharacterized protein n=1 Tax=Hypsibius exemplaris TaxID=2072580 RepID=A0A9X6NCC3_HYPEX|nr:hypothetical protein BV898_15943 [Hypsibius exemplaris]
MRYIVLTMASVLQDIGRHIFAKAFHKSNGCVSTLLSKLNFPSLVHLAFLTITELRSHQNPSKPIKTHQKPIKTHQKPIRNPSKPIRNPSETHQKPIRNPLKSTTNSIE